jgi:Raf kinase inhibitor-like YbhB/YbcL family protein
MQMVFYTGSQFPPEYQGDAFLAMHGSWNRNPPSGYEVVRIRFKDGKPESIETFISGFLVAEGDEYGAFGRPFGLALAQDGALYIGDDANGLIYRVSHDNRAVARNEADPSNVADAGDVALAEPESPQQLAKELLPATGKLEVTSPAFLSNAKMPERFSAYGENFSPEISWSKGPDGTKSYVLLMEDPEAKKPKPFVHWILTNVPADVTHLREGLPSAPALPDPPGARQGTNSRGSIGYFGPRPPAGGNHHYHFQVFALDTVLNLEPSAGRKEVLAAIKGHVLAQGDLIGVFSKPTNGGS